MPVKWSSMESSRSENGKYQIICSQINFIQSCKVWKLLLNIGKVMNDCFIPGPFCPPHTSSFWMRIISGYHSSPLEAHRRFSMSEINWASVVCYCFHCSCWPSIFASVTAVTTSRLTALPALGWYQLALTICLINVYSRKEFFEKTACGLFARKQIEWLWHFDMKLMFFIFFLQVSTLYTFTAT